MACVVKAALSRRPPLRFQTGLIGDPGSLRGIQHRIGDPARKRGPSTESGTPPRIGDPEQNRGPRPESGTQPRIGDPDQACGRPAVNSMARNPARARMRERGITSHVGRSRYPCVQERRATTKLQATTWSAVRLFIRHPPPIPHRAFARRHRPLIQNYTRR